VFCLNNVSWCGSDYSDKELSVRLPSAFVHFTEVTVAGGETAANRLSSAVNPASAGWTKLPAEHGILLAPYYSHIFLDVGTKIDLYGEAGMLETENYGTFLPTLSQIRSNSETMKNDLTFDYKVDTAQITWADRWENVGFGFNLNFAEAEVINRMDDTKIAESHSESYRFRFGALYEFKEKWLAGLVMEYGFAPFRRTTYAPTPFGTFTFKETGTHQQFILRPAVSYEYAEYSNVFLDYQYGGYFNPTDELKNHRFNLGIDHRLVDWLFVRGASFSDIRGNVGVSCGIGAHFSRYTSLDVGYQYNTLPELGPEFGRSQIIQAAFSFRF
jgi:hypothetical protein